MPRFKAQTSIHSCFLDKETLIEIEGYILSKACALDKIDREQATDNYTIEIQYSDGEEEIESIDLHSREKFSNDIEKISISYINYLGSLNSLKMTFSYNEFFSEIKVIVDDTHPRDVANGIINELTRKYSDNNNLNFLFHGKYGFSKYMILGLISGVFLAPLFAKNISYEDTAIPQFISLFILVALTIWHLLSLANPYTVFDTKLNEVKQRVVKWVLYGTIGGIVFGGLGRLILG